MYLLQLYIKKVNHSYLEGVVGTFSAYLIARLEITKQLNLRDQKDKSRILLEIRIRKAEESES